MNISLDNICFYSQPPPAKSLPRAVPVSCWRPYETPLAPRALSHALPSRPPSPRTTISIAPDARPDAPPRFRSPVRQDPDLRAVRNEFDIEIERIAMAQNGQVTHEADLDMNRDMALRNGTVTDVPESRSTSLATEPPDQCPLVAAVSDLDPAFIPAESDTHHSGSPISSADKLHRDSTPSLGTSDEADKDPTPPGVRFTCTRASPSPSPDLLGNQHPQAEPGSEIMRHESVLDDTKAAPESCGVPMEDGSDVTTTQSVQINHLSVGEAGLDNDERAGLTEESQVPASLRFRQRTRSVKQSKVPMTSTRCLRPRPNATSTQRLPAVSVVIPTRRADELGASTKMTPPTTARRYVEWGDSDGDINNAGPTPAVRGEYSPSAGVSSPQARGRPRKRPKRAMETISSSTNGITRKCTSQAPNPLDGGFAVALGKTQEIFGRGVLRIQSHGPRHAYFMTFLPEVTDRPSMVSASEMSPDQPSHPDNISENASSRQGVCREGRKRTVSTASEDDDAWSTRQPTNSQRNSRSRTDRSKAKRKPSRRLRWSSGEVDLLVKLRRDEQRPWSEVVKLFSDRYPGRTSGSIQVYWSTKLKKTRWERAAQAEA